MIVKLQTEHHSEFLSLKTYAASSNALPRLETGKVVWVLSFDHWRIRINTAFRYSYVILVFRHFLDKIK